MWFESVVLFKLMIASFTVKFMSDTRLLPGLRPPQKYELQLRGNSNSIPGKSTTVTS